MNKKEKAKAIIDILKQRYDDAACALHYAKDYELMIAVRLSAQCTDARVNLVTPALFAAYPTLEAMAAADIADVENYVCACPVWGGKPPICCWATCTPSRAASCATPTASASAGGWG